ncbi:MAG: hypothetical protein J6C78_07555, partial [Muribaculaceae bacterium]|nr:hypothetical protein [Muribaculaceae bacterium]
GCKDYDDDIDALNKRVEAVETLVKELQSQIQKGAVITDVTKTDKGVTVTLSNGNTFELTNGINGQDGTPGSVISINSDGYWCIDGKPTQYKAQGEKGDKGDKGDKGEPGDKGETGGIAPVYYYPGTTGAEDGYWVKVTVAEDGTETKEITNVKWTVADTSKGVVAIWDNGKLILRNVGGTDKDIIVTTSTDLRSLVFEPEMVLDGQNAMEYKYIPYKPYTVNAEIEGGMLVHQVKTATGYDAKEVAYKVKGEAVQAEAWTFLNPTWPKNYWLNPREAVISEYTQKNLGTSSNDLDFISTGRAAAAAPTAKFYGLQEKDGDMQMIVGITMKGELVKTQEESDPNQLGIFYPAKSDKAKITDLAVQAPLDEGKTEIVTSTYGSVYASQLAIEAIAYNTTSYANDYIIATKEFETDKLVGAATVHGTPKENGRHLYGTAKDAAENSATVELAYNNATGIDLNELVLTHAAANSARSWNSKKIWDYTNADLKARGMKYAFERVNFSIGSNATEQSQNHAVIEQGANGHYYVIACGVQSNSDTNILDCQPDLSLKAKAVSSVGRTPLVRVELRDTVNNKIVKVGYIKIKIVAPENPLETPLFNLGDYFYKCENATKTITWHAIESKLLETTRNTSKETFDATYEVVKGSDGSVMQWVKTNELDVNGKPTWTNASLTIGTITEIPNDGAETTDVFSWTITRQDFVNCVGHDTYPVINETRWIKYAPKKYLGNSNFNVEPVYLPIQITLKYPKAVMSNKIAKYWYAEGSMNPASDALSADQRQVLHANVEVPSTTTDENGASCNFMFSIDSRFELNKIGHSDLHQWATASTTATFDNTNWASVQNYICWFGETSNAGAENAPKFTIQPDAWNPALDWNVLTNFSTFSEDNLVYFYYFTLGNKTATGVSGTTYTLKTAYKDDAGNITPATVANSPVMLYTDAPMYEYKGYVLLANNVEIAEIHYNLETGHVRKHGAWLELKNNDTAKDLLNVPTEWTAKATDAEAAKKLLDATFDVQIGVATFNKNCGAYLPLTNNIFKTEILKPVYAKAEGPIAFTDANDGGAAGTTVDIASLVSFYDWRQYQFADHLNYYNYYEVSDISIDPKDIKTDISGTMLPLNQTSLDVEFHVVRNGAQVDDGFTTPAVGSAPAANATWAQILAHFGKLTYTNNTGTIVNFNIQVPVKITHKWSQKNFIVWVNGHVGRTDAN